ncbi:hypothetical protein L195_g020982 [Trifolium pratense]|uniref:Uncharacterized protein n=1 Tax=Trifolium pratense TaxID=57577 RepID=A0A2K3N451_TRIPR|nr:hypothetical protein L195_g020982 [Trifolium pratense]
MKLMVTNGRYFLVHDHSIGAKIATSMTMKNSQRKKKIHCHSSRSKEVTLAMLLDKDRSIKSGQRCCHCVWMELRWGLVEVGAPQFLAEFAYLP